MFKRFVLLFMSLIMALSFSGCDSSSFQKDFSAKDALKIEDIDWNIVESTLDGQSIVSFNYKNKTKYTILDVEMKFVQKEGTTKIDRSVFDDLKKSDYWTDEKISEIYIMGYNRKCAKPGESVGDSPCNINGTYTLVSDIDQFDVMEPDSVEIAFIGKDGLCYTVYYDYKSQTFSESTLGGKNIHEWSESELSKKLPKEKFTAVVVTTDKDDCFSFKAYDISRNDFENYIESLKNNGFDIIKNDGSNSFNAKDSDGAEVSFNYVPLEECMGGKIELKGLRTETTAVTTTNEIKVDMEADTASSAVTTAATDNKNETDELLAILDEIKDDIDATKKIINEEAVKTNDKIGDSYDGYIKNVNSLREWYDFTENESSALYKRVLEKSYEYFCLAAASPNHTDSKFIKNVMESYTEEIYDNALNDYGSQIYDDIYPDIYEHYDEIINTGIDKNFDDWLNTSTEFYDEWLNSSTDFYNSWVEASSNIYTFCLNVENSFMLENYNIKPIYEEEISKINSSFENNDQTISNDSVDNMNKEDEISIINALEELSDISDEYVSVVDKLKENPNDYDAIEEYLSVIIKLAKLVEKYENEDYVEMQNDFTDEEKASYMNLYKEIDDKMTKANEELEKLDITLFD